MQCNSTLFPLLDPYGNYGCYTYKRTFTRVMKLVFGSHVKNRVYYNHRIME